MKPFSNLLSLFQSALKPSKIEPCFDIKSQALIVVIPAKRLYDDYGAGHFKAPRGDREHDGQDYNVSPDSIVLSCCDGEVVKIGYPYKDDLSYRYVRVKTKKGYFVSYLYVYPTDNIEVGKKVKRFEPVGVQQDITTRYPDKPGKKHINNHVHFDVYYKGAYIDPAKFEKLLFKGLV